MPRPRPTLADYAVVAIAPALIMLLVGSLVYFLIEVFYQGAYDVRLKYVMALFVMAAVLIGRISITEGREYASLFAIGLGVAVALATVQFVQFQGPLRSISPLVSLSLVGLIWWCADKLTWDCTVIDEQQDASGEGLLQTAGLEREQTATPGAPSAEPEATTSREQPEHTLWQKFVQYRRRPHAPGVWVLYFSLAALPIFGFGQWVIPAGDLASRRYVFHLLIVYMAAGLGLLLITSFLGLRRYLRQRRLEMPLEMAASWLGVGAVMIVALLLFCMLLPRRNPEYSLTQLPIFAGSRDLTPSRWGFGNDGPQDDQQARRSVHRDDAEAQSQGSGEDQGQSDRGRSQQGSQQGSQSQQSSKQSGNQQQTQNAASQSKAARARGQQQSDSSGRQQQQSSRSQDGDSNEAAGEPQSKFSDESSRGGGSDRDQKSKSGSPEKGGSSQTDRDSKSGGESDTDESQRGDGSQTDDPSRGGGGREDQANRERSDQSETGKSQSRGGGRSSRPNPAQSFNPSRMISALGSGLGGLMKFIYWLVVILVVAFLLWRYWPQVVKAVRDFVKALRDFWDRLWGRTLDDAEPEEVPAAAGAPPPRPFADFPDPFLSGMAQRYPIEKLIQYSFEAFEAWARERGCGREPEQTPHEFALAVARQEVALGSEARRLAELYCWSAYGRDAVPGSSLEHLRRFWSAIRGQPPA